MTWGETKMVRVNGSSSYPEGSSYRGQKLKWMNDGNPREIDFGSS